MTHKSKQRLRSEFEACYRIQKQGVKGEILADPNDCDLVEWLDKHASDTVRQILGTFPEKVKKSTELR